MRKLDTLISDWRQQMLAAGIQSPAPLDELESHLREDIEHLRSSGMPEVEAFETAVSRLGKPNLMQAEFLKTQRSSTVIATLAWCSWIVVVALLALMLGRGLLIGKTGVLLAAHVFCVSAGYLAVFVAGGLSLCHAFCRRLRIWTVMRQRSLGSTVLSLGRLSAGLIIPGVLLGMVWSGTNQGHFLTGDPREIGGMCAAAWMTGLLMARRFGRAGDHAIMLLGIGGSMIVSLAWFGTGEFVHRYGPAGSWTLAGVLGIHLVGLVMGLLPAPEVGRSGSHSRTTDH